MTDKIPQVRPLASNRRAAFDYFIHERLEAGIVLSGTEVKSARTGKIQLSDAFVDFKSGEAFLVGAHISPYSHGNRENHLPDRPRKLLLSRREIDKQRHTGKILQNYACDNKRDLFRAFLRRLPSRKRTNIRLAHLLAAVKIAKNGLKNDPDRYWKPRDVPYSRFLKLRKRIVSTGRTVAGRKMLSCFE